MQNICFAQQASTPKMAVGFTYSGLAVTDQAMSALQYRGGYGGLAANYEVGNNNGLLQNFYAGFGSGKLRNREYGTSLSVTSINLGYSALPLIHQYKSLRLLAGGVFDNNLALRNRDQYVNNNNYYEFAGSLAFAAIVVYQPAAKPRGKQSLFTVQSAFVCPVLTALSRSASVYNRVNDVQSPVFSTYIKNINLVSFSRYHKFSWNTQIGRQVFKNSGFALNYQWDYYRVIEPGQVQSISHTAALKYFWYL